MRRITLFDLMACGFLGFLWSLYASWLGNSQSWPPILTNAFSIIGGFLIGQLMGFARDRGWW